MVWGMIAVYVCLIILGIFIFWIIGARVFKLKERIEIQKEILQELKRIKFNLKE